MPSRGACFIFTLVCGQSGSAMMPATAYCFVIATSEAVFSESVVPDLPATGALTADLTAAAVRLPPHLLVEELSPTGQRAASTAARATSVLTRFSQRGLAMSSFLPSGSLISCTGMGSQYLPSAARVA